MNHHTAAILIRSLAHRLSSALRAAAAMDRSGFAKYKSNIVYPWTNTYRTLLLHLHPPASNRHLHSGQNFLSKKVPTSSNSIATYLLTYTTP